MEPSLLHVKRIRNKEGFKEACAAIGLHPGKKPPHPPALRLPQGNTDFTARVSCV
jgi:hypothetical protein